MKTTKDIVNFNYVIQNREGECDGRQKCHKS